MTKANRITIATYWDCLDYVKTWGIKRNEDDSIVTFNRLTYSDNETVTTRTLNAIDREIEGLKRNTQYCAKIENAEATQMRLYAIEMLEGIVRKHRARAKEEA